LPASSSGLFIKRGRAFAGRLDVYVLHAGIRIGAALVMIGEHCEAASGEFKTFPDLSLYLYVEDVDATVAAAVERGAVLLAPPSDKFHGNREGGIRDPFGITWWVATHQETLTPAQLRERTRAAHGSPLRRRSGFAPGKLPEPAGSALRAA
jgi:uncharacterized glyoxalase superfamily protein PhnB